MTWGDMAIMLDRSSAELRRVWGDRPDPKLGTGRTPRDVEVRGVLPWERQDMDSEEILRAVSGRRVVWRNAITGGEEEAVVESNPHLRLTNHATRLTLHWRDPHRRFRACYLDAVLRVL